MLTLAATATMVAAGQQTVIVPKQAAKPSTVKPLNLKPHVDGKLSLRWMDLPGSSPFVTNPPVDPTQPVFDKADAKDAVLTTTTPSGITVKSTTDETLTFNFVELYDNTWTSYDFGVYSLEVPSLTMTRNSSIEDKFYAADFCATLNGYLYSSVPLSNGQAFHYVVDLSDYSTVKYTIGDMIKAKSSTTDRTTGTVYGCFLNADATEYYLAKFDTEAFAIGDSIGSFGTTGFSALGCNRHGELYGITSNGVLYKIDKTDASLTKIKALGLSSNYNTSGCFDLTRNIFYYAHFASATQSNLFEVDVDTGKATLLCNVPHCAELQGLWLDAPPYDYDAPAAPTDFAVNYVDDALTGNVSFKLPTTYFSGDAPEAGATVSYSLYYNDELIKSATGNYGEQVSIDVPEVKRGEYAIKLTVEGNGFAGPTTTETRYIGYDDVSGVYNASLSIVDNKFSVTWSTPTAVHGGYIRTSDFSYDIVRHPDEVTMVTNYTQTSYEFTAADGLANGEYKFGIVLHYYDPDTDSYQTRDEVLTNVRVYGAYEVPFSYTFDLASEASQIFTVEDTNNDGITWQFVNGYAAISYNENQAMDDWLISMPIHLEANTIYLITENMQSANGDSYPEKAEIWLGTAPNSQSMTTCLQPVTTLTDAAELSMTYIPEQEGIYYIGIHGCSDADQYMLMVTLLGVEKLGTPDAPAPADNLTVVEDDSDGNRNAAVSFDVPTKTYKGDELTSVTKVEVYRNSVLVYTYDDVVPGQHISFVQEIAKSRNQIYAVRTYNEYGCGGEAVASTYIGWFTPQSISKLNSATCDDDNSVRLWWEAVNKDIYGNVINRTMWYQPMVVYPNGAQQTAGNGIYAGTTTFTETDVNTRYAALSNGTYDATVNDQFLVYYYMNNYYYEGKGLWQGDTHSGSPAFSDYVPVGKAYTLPYKESFANCDVNTVFIAHQEGDGELGLYGESSIAPIASTYDGDGGMLIYAPVSLGDYATLTSGRVNLREAVVPRLSFMYYAVNESQDKVSVEITYNGVTETVGKFVLGATGVEGWTKAIVDLDKYAGKPVLYTFRFDCVNGMSTTLIDDIEIYDNEDNNLAVASFVVPSSARTDQELTASATILNNGHDAIAQYTVNFYANGQLVEQKQGTDLAHGATETFAFAFTPHVNDGSSIDFYVEVVAEGDANADDNRSAVATTKIFVPSYPVISDLKAEADLADVTLTWSQPQLDGDISVPTTDDVEAYTAYSIGLPGSELGDEDFIGNWTMVDADGNETYQLLTVDFANNHDDGAKKAWMVFNYDQSGIAEAYPRYADDYKPLSGKQCFMCVASQPGTNSAGTNVGNDDWLISPLLSGLEQTISFNARANSDAYGKESYEVLYSTTTTDIDKFIKLGEKSVDNNWTLDSYTLPAGAKYFAIRCTSYDVWALMVDDIDYQAGVEGQLELKGYNIYRNNKAVDSIAALQTQYVEKDVEDGTHTYNVTAVYNVGESALSNDAVITLKNSEVESLIADGITISVANKVITVKGAVGEQINIYGVDGRTIASAVGTDVDKFAVSYGIYVVRAGDVIVKVVVD